MTNILALDLGIKTGFCFLLNGEIYGGTKHFIGERPQRLAQLAHWLTEHMSHEPDVVVYERPFCRGLHATRSLWGAAGVVEAACSEVAAVLDVNVQSIKTWAGRGSTEKTGTMEKCRELGIEPLDDNHADAVCLAFYTLEKMEIEDAKG